jgi:hypothetical protein
MGGRTVSATKGTYWFWSDWLGDQAVRRLTPAERGVWIDLIALAAVGSPVGYVCDDRGRKLSDDEIARVTNAGSVEEVTTLINGILEKGAASRDRSGRLFNRRMVRKADLAAKRALSGKTGGEHTKLKWQGFQRLSQQVPRVLSGHLPHSTSPPLTNPNITRTLPSESGAAKGVAEELREATIERIRKNKGLA